MKKALLAMAVSVPFLLTACGEKPAEPVVADPELTAAPMESTEAVENELNQVGDTATASADDVVVDEVVVAEE